MNTHKKGNTIFEVCLSKKQVSDFLEEFESLDGRIYQNWKNAVDMFAEATLYKKGIIKKFLKELLKNEFR